MLHTPLALRPPVTIVGIQLEQERKQVKQRAHQQHAAAVAVLDIGRMNPGTQQQTLRIYQQMPLLGFDLLARVVAAWEGQPENAFNS